MSIIVLPIGLFKITAAVIALLGTPSEAESKDRVTWLCEGENSISYTDQGYKLNALIETPNPGYNYNIEKVDINKYEIELFSNQSVAAMVIDSVFIEEFLGEIDVNQDILIKLNKPYGWGPNEIHCKING